MIFFWSPIQNKTRMFSYIQNTIILQVNTAAPQCCIYIYNNVVIHFSYLYQKIAATAICILHLVILEFLIIFLLFSLAKSSFDFF